MRNGSLSRREWLLETAGTNSDTEDDMTLQSKGAQPSSESAPATSTNTPSGLGRPSKAGFTKKPENMLGILKNLERQADEKGLVKKMGFGMSIMREFNFDAHGIGGVLKALRMRGFVREQRGRFKGGRSCKCLVITSKGKKFMHAVEADLAPGTRKGRHAVSLPNSKPAPAVKASSTVARPTRPDSAPGTIPNMGRNALHERIPVRTGNQATNFDVIIQMASDYERALQITQDPNYKRAHEIVTQAREVTDAITKSAKP